MFGKKSIGDSVASEMASVMQSDSYKQTFAGPAVNIKTAAKKKEEEDEKVKAKKEEDKKDKKKKPSKKQAYVIALNGLNKVAEIFDDLGLEKSAYVATRALEVVVKEAQEMGAALYSDDSCADDNDAKLKHDHPHVHSEENPEACHRHPELGFADDGSGYSEEDKKILKELEDAFGGPEKMREMVEKGQFADLFKDQNSDDDEDDGPKASELLSGESPLAALMEDIEIPDTEPVTEKDLLELKFDDDLKGSIIHELEGNLAEEDIKFVLNMMEQFGLDPEEAVEKAKALNEKIKEEGPGDFRVKAMIVLAPMIKAAALKKKVK